MASVAPLIATLSRTLGLDPRAVLAVARGEGGLVNRPGTQDIGDLAGGGSYGPFQLYSQGALPRSLRGNRARADSWAWSPAGIRYALTQMAKTSRGLSGADAVRSIVTRFERPANPQASIAAALGRLGAGVPSGQPAPAPGSSGTERGSVSRLRALRQNLDSDPLTLVRALKAASPSLPTEESPVLPTPQTATGGPYSVEELFYDPLGGFKQGQPTGAIGGHGGHVHVAEDDPMQMLRIIQLAQKMGLRVSENPWVDPVDPVHTKNSYHYRSSPFRARMMGRAADISGDPRKMAALYRALAPRGR